ncbi:MAG: ATP-binding protein [Myxococcota bacterium]|nr:ATP-binding protein [Myxococcota bacterium]
MYHFGPNETYVLVYEVLALSQGILLVYLLALGSKSHLKRCVDRAVFAYFLYSIFAVFIGRSMYRLAEDGMYAHFGQLPPYLGIDYQTLNLIMTSFLLAFSLVSMNLWYALLKRKIDLPMIVSYSVSVSLVFLHYINKETMITSRENAQLFSSTLLLIFFYGVVIMGNGLRKMEPGLEKKRLRIFFIAYLIPFLGGFVLVYLNARDLVNQAQFNIWLIALGGVRAILFVWAIVIYKVFRMDLTYASEDIFENMDDPVLLLSPKDEITRANAAAQRYLGIEDAHSATDIRQIVPKYSRAQARFEVSIETQEGLREYNCAKTTIVRQDELIGSVLLFRDITRQKELARMKTEFTSTVSHELRTPLTSVLGFAKIIQKRFNDVIMPSYQPTEKKEKRAVKQIGKNLDVIISESKRLTSLINDVLDISKMEAGRIEWRFARTSLNGIIEQALQATDGLFGSKPVGLVRDIPTNLPEVVADSDRIIQVVINLISNAVKFTDEGSVTVKVEVERGNLLVHVTDTGTGISKADQKLVFEKYKQVGDVITDKPQGTGLGLPISKQIVEQHGGSIWVDSIIGEGTTFSFSLPLADLPQTLHKPISFSDLLKQIDRLKYRPPSGIKKILVVDDESSIRQILRQSFEAAGHKVVEAEDGVVALKMVHEHQPDAIILDIMMPKMNGFDVAATLKNDPKYMGIPIIVLTVVDDAQRIYGLGVERYITKPFEPQEIVTEAELLIQQRGEDNHVVLLGDLSGRIEDLRSRLSGNGHTLHVAADRSALPRLLSEHQPRLLIVGQTEEPLTSAELQSFLGATSVLTRRVHSK